LAKINHIDIDTRTDDSHGPGMLWWDTAKQPDLPSHLGFTHNTLIHTEKTKRKTPVRATSGATNDRCIQYVQCLPTRFRRRCTILTVETCPSDQLPTTSITPMATTGRNGPLAPHMRPFVPCRCVGVIEDNTPSTMIWFLRG